MPASVATIDQELAEAAACLARMPETPGTRELRTRIETYRRTVEGWAARPPSDHQVDAMRECVTELLVIARSKTPTLRRRVSVDEG